MDLDPIIVPPNWTAEQDITSFEDRFDAKSDHVVAALQDIADGYETLTNTVDSALEHFEGLNRKLVPIHSGTLTLREKLHRLSTITNTFNQDYRYKERFAEHIHGCLWADAERGRIMTTFYLGEDRHWLRVLGDLSDAIHCAAIELEQAMKSEHKDFSV